MAKKAQLGWVRANNQFTFTLIADGQAIPVDEWCRFNVVHTGGNANVSCLFRGITQGQVRDT